MTAARRWLARTERRIEAQWALAAYAAGTAGTAVYVVMQMIHATR